MAKSQSSWRGKLPRGIVNRMAPSQTATTAPVSATAFFTTRSLHCARMTVADRRVAEWLFFLTALTYAYFYAGGGWNQNAAFDLTRAIVERHTFAIDAYASNTGDVSFANGHVYANKAPALSWIAVIPYALVRGF